MKRKSWLLLTLLIALVLSGCDVTPEHTPRASPDWSMGKIVGLASTSDQVAIQTDEEGNTYLAWVGLEKQIELAKLDNQAHLVAHRPLDLSMATPKAPHLLLSLQGKFHLIWLESKGLYYAQLGADGEVLSEPTLLSLPEREADWARMVLNQGGGAEVFWSDDSFEGAGLYHLSVGPGGEVVSPSSLILPEGIDPSPQVDREGLIHLAWFQRPSYHQREVYYATFDPISRSLKGETKVADISFRSGQIVEGPELGLDEENVYIFWGVESRARGEMTSFSYYASFPLGQPEYRGGVPVEIPRTESPEYQGFTYESISGQFTFNILAPFSAVGTDFVANPYTLSGQEAELVAVFSAGIFDRGTPDLQIALGVFSEGQPKGYQIINKTRTASVSPNLVADAVGNLHLTWLDTAGFGQLRVLYASTSPQVKQVLNRLTLAIVIDRTLSVLMAILSIATFAPVIVAWLFFPTLWLILFYFFTSESELLTKRAWLALGIAILLLLTSKLFIYPNLLSYFPFLTSLAPQLVAFLSRWLFPTILTGVGVAVMFGYLKRSRSRSLFMAYFIGALTDCLLSLAIYVPTLMGNI